jgi:hypothetical protein
VLEIAGTIGKDPRFAANQIAWLIAPSWCRCWGKFCHARASISWNACVLSTFRGPINEVDEI